MSEVQQVEISSVFDIWKKDRRLKKGDSIVNSFNSEDLENAVTRKLVFFVVTIAVTSMRLKLNSHKISDI